MGTVSSASALRRDLAQQIPRAYAGTAAVAVILGGSVARGHADRYSDLEVSVIWKEPPTDLVRDEAISAAGGDLEQLYPVADEVPGPVWSDAWKIGRRAGVPFTGIEVDMQHLLAETVEETLRDVLEAFDPDPPKQNLVGGILHGIPLYGRELVEGWQRQAAAYPDGLRVAVVRGHAQIEGLWRLDAYAVRENPVAGYQVLAAAQEQILHTLLGLNRVYYSGFKSLPAVVGELEIAPLDLLHRLHACYPLRAGESRTLMTSLAEEIHDLVEVHAPEIDVERLRQILRYERPLWD